MDGIGGLLAAVLPLSLVGAVSPVILLKGYNAVSEGGTKGAWRFIVGNVIVLAVIGGASMGLLGTSTVSYAEREVASRAVDRFLGLLLICYAVHLGVQFRRSRATRDTEDTPEMSGWLSLGLTGMATNFSTLPVFMSAAQRLGASDVFWLVRGLLRMVVIVIVALPAWLPLLLTRVAHGRGQLSDRLRQCISEGTQIMTIVACVLGAGFLMLHGLQGL